MPEDNEKIIFCHRSLGAFPVSASPIATVGGQQQIALVPLKIPCIKEECAMWSKEHEECLEVQAAYDSCIPKKD